MSGNTKVMIGLLAVVLVALTAAVIYTRTSGTPTADGGTTPDAGAVSERLVRPESHRLNTAADGKVTVVEFLDFECEACGAAFPGVERLREEYADRITYVVRYFPIESHFNAENAARAAQAAANEGRFEAMYLKLFEAQPQWGEQQVSAATLFEGFAQELGLGINRFRADVAAEETIQRVRAEREDGYALGVQGTPTFFINGSKFTGTPSYEGLKAAVDAALAG